MNNDHSPLEQWLFEINAAANSTSKTWDPGFDGGRQLVVAKLGPYQQAYQRPLQFKQRFYHQIFNLPVDEWRLNSQIKLHGDFCTIEALVVIRFQASVKYAQTHLEALPNINQHIKSSCTTLIKDVVEQELRQLADGEWIDLGLNNVERRIETVINETLTLQYLQCRALCELLASFSEHAELSKLDGRFARDNIYLKVIKKNFEAQEQQQKEQLRQELLLEEQRIERQQRLIDQYNHEQQLQRIEQEQNAFNRKRQLEEQEKQLTEQLEIQQRLHREQVFHEQNLKRLEQNALAETQLHNQTQQLQIEEQLLKERLEHQQKLKAIQLAAEITEYEKSQEAWNATNERLNIEKIEQEKRLKQLEAETQLALLDTKQNEEHKVQERLLKEKMLHEARLKDMELEMQIHEHEKRFAATQQLDNYIRRDIELLILERHRGELIQEVRKTKNDDIRAIPAPESLDNQ